MTRCTDHRTITPTLKVCDKKPEPCIPHYESERVLVVRDDVVATNLMRSWNMTDREITERLLYSHTGIVSYAV